MLDRETVIRVAALAEAAGRADAAAALAEHLGAEALFIFVEDAEVDAMLPAPGLAQTIAGGSAWRAFLRKCRAPGLHKGIVAYPATPASATALACSGAGVVLVFVGNDGESSSLEPLSTLLPLLGATLRAEHRVAAATGEVLVAREDARHAGVLARSLDAARSDLERQAKSLTAAQRRADIAMRAKDEFLAMLGHELRNPLAPIMTALQLLRLKGGATREHDILDRQVGNVMRLVDDLLDVSRIASGKVELRKEHVEIATVAKRAIELASPLIEQKHQVLSVSVSNQGMPVNGDPDRLAQVFSNLLTNAAKYSDASSRISFSAQRVLEKVVVRVKDEGFGIEPHMLEAIFDQFIQQQQSSERSQGGLGLGLAIVKNLVSLHGGTVRAMSDGRGKGSEFVVELPSSSRAVAVTEEKPSVAATALAGARVSREGKRVLLVDDNNDAAELLSEALTDIGYTVRTASDGPSALLVARDFEPQIALLDIGLPVMDGYELGRQLRQAQGTAVLRLVALTGYGQASDRARSQEAGFDAHLVKPIDLAELDRLLERLYQGNSPA